MSRAIMVLLISCASAAIVVGCGSEHISVPKSDPPDIHEGAILFNQRCSGCHTLSYAATQGSAANVRTREITNGPNFNVRCERPVTRVLYAIQNGGFSGAIMPQNVVVGKQAQDVAQFVAKFAGRQAPQITGQQNCEAQPIGTIPLPTATTATSSSSTTTTTTSSSTSTGGKSKKKNKK